MFTMTHMYFSFEFLDKNNAVTLGAMFPDTFIFSPLTYQQTHSNAKKLVEFCVANYPQYIQFAQSVLLHETLDYFGDKNWEGSGVGYCFINGRDLVSDIMRVYDTHDESFATFKAHNFIEMAIQVLLVDTYPGLPELFREAINDIVLIDGLAGMLGDYYKVDCDVIKRSLLRFPTVVEYEDPSLRNMIAKSNLQTLIKNKKTIDIDEGIKLISQAREILLLEYFPNTIDELCVFAMCKRFIADNHLLDI